MLKNIQCQLGHFLIPADEPRFDSIQTSLSISVILLMKGFQFIDVLVQQSVEKNYLVIVVIDSFDYYVGQIFILVGE